MSKEQEASWAAEEFAEVDLGDKRLDARLVTLCDRFSDAPESPINQACADWAETKAAYRFFRNETVEADKILAAHRRKTGQRAMAHKTVLAIQDTSYFVYTSHPKTEGLGKMSMKKGCHVENIYSKGLVMHACLAMSTQGLPLGLLDQNIFARKLRPEHERRRNGGRYIQDVLPVEEKETYRWLQALKATEAALPDTRVVAACDREADLYDFFKLSHRHRPIRTPVSQPAPQQRKTQDRITARYRHACRLCSTPDYSRIVNNPPLRGRDRPANTGRNGAATFATR